MKGKVSKKKERNKEENNKLFTVVGLRRFDGIFITLVQPRNNKTCLTTAHPNSHHDVSLNNKHPCINNMYIILHRVIDDSYSHGRVSALCLCDDMCHNGLYASDIISILPMLRMLTQKNQHGNGSGS